MVVDSIIIQVLSWVSGFVLGVGYVALKMATTGGLTPEDEATLNIVGFVVVC